MVTTRIGTRWNHRNERQRPRGGARPKLAPSGLPGVALVVLVVLSAAGCGPSRTTTSSGGVTLTMSDTGKTVTVHSGEALVVKLDEHADGGYQWWIDRIDLATLTLSGSAFTPPTLSAGQVGGTGTRTFTFSPTQAGTSPLALKEWRVWEGDPSVITRFAVTIAVAGTSVPPPSATLAGCSAAAGSTTTGNGATGTISGSLQYPSEAIPPLRIEALSTTSGGRAYEVTTQAKQATYTITGVVPGAYHVLAYLLPTQTATLRAGYTPFILCAHAAGELSHTLIDVQVYAGETVSHIDPTDWYAPTGTFPPPPS